MRVGGWGKEREIRVVKHNVVENIRDSVYKSHLHSFDKCQCLFCGCLVDNHDQ